MNYRQELLYKSTPSEKSVCRILEGMGVKFVRQMQIRTGRKTFYADIYIPSLRLVIEVDGKYHFTQDQKRRDANRSACLRRMGLHVFRICNTTATSRKAVYALIKRGVSRENRRFPGKSFAVAERAFIT